MRIVTWNVNGIRRVHRDLQRQGKRTWLACLEDLDGDLVCIQELKSERATMDPIYVDVPGWRSYFSFPVDKKAYSGVAIYVRDRYRPVRVETAICGPAYDRYFELDRTDTIGGYPSDISILEARQVDREGRAVVLDFGGFVLIGTYCPAGAESEERVAYRQLWWRALDERCRNLIRSGREVILTGDLNVNCAAIDQVEADVEEYEYPKLGPVGKTFYRLLHGTPAGTRDAGDVAVPIGLEPDPGATDGIFVDLSRHYFPDREGMYTCWSVKLSAREGNYGARIDYVLASNRLLSYFTSSDARPDIHGSDHCPVFAHLDPEGCEPPLIITRATGTDTGPTSNFTTSQRTLSTTYFRKPDTLATPSPSRLVSTDIHVLPTIEGRVLESEQLKRKGESIIRDGTKAQKSISSFFKTSPGRSHTKTPAVATALRSPTRLSSTVAVEEESPGRSRTDERDGPIRTVAADYRPPTERTHSIEKRIEVSNAFATLFTRPEVPVCSGHGKPAKLQKTKKKGANQGREFWMCAVPLGDGQCTYWHWRRK